MTSQSLPCCTPFEGVFVTGTDTGVGKTVVAAAITAALSLTHQLRVTPLKPVLSGLDEPASPGWPHDHELLAHAAGRSDATGICRHMFGPALSPHAAAAQAGVKLEVAALACAVGNEVQNAEATIVEGAGGLLVPLNDTQTVCDLAVALGLPVIVVARCTLGTINHTLLTLAAARQAGLDICAVVLNRWPHSPSTAELSARSAIEQRAAVDVVTFPEIESAQRVALAKAGASLPLRDWFAIS